MESLLDNARNLKTTILYCTLQDLRREIDRLRRDNPIMCNSRAKLEIEFGFILLQYPICEPSVSTPVPAKDGYLD